MRKRELRSEGEQKLAVGGLNKLTNHSTRGTDNLNK